jgi:uncharacterized coiled-coil protein SlyX
MGLLDRIRMPKCGATLVVLVGFALSAALSSMAIGAQQSESELYRWLDRHGVVRYTTDLGRIPKSRRNTVVRVVPHSIPTSTTSVAPPAPVAPLPGLVPAADADPFSAPGQVLNVAPQASAPVTSSWPELDARIAELEMLVAKDEETIKQMVSTPQVGDHDELIDSEELREIGARLPVLQGELAELKRWRDDPDTR